MIGEILGFVAVFLLSWWGLGSGLAYLAGVIWFQIPFSRQMHSLGVYDEKTHRSVLTTKWIGAAVTLLLSGAAVFFLVRQLSHMGLVMMGLGILVGFLRGRHVLRRDQRNVCRFVRTHSVCMDRKKTAAFLKQEYGVELDTLVPR